MKSHQFTTLDGLRGVAAAAVVTRHATDYFSWGSQYIPSLKPGAPPVPVGPLFESYLAVDFFFVLSGFVLAHAYWRRLCSGMSAVEFICLRLIRLYPLYLIALVFAIAAACIEVVAGGRSVTSLVKNIIPAVLFLPAPALTVFGTLFPLNMPTWSLFFELVANSGFGVIGKRIKPAMLAVFVCSVALILISAVMTKTCGFGAKAGGALDYGTNWRSIAAGFLRVSFSFSAGILVYWIWLFRRPQWSIPPALLLVAFAIILASAPVVEARIAFDLIAIIVVFPLLVLLGAVSAPSRTGSPIYFWLGATSYAVFVLHFPLYKLSLFAREYTHTSPSWMYGAGYLILLYTTATVLDRYVDGRVRGMLKNRFFATTQKNIAGQHQAQPEPQTVDRLGQIGPDARHCHHRR